MTGEIGEIVPVYKPRGMTSFEVVRRFRNELSKIGSNSVPNSARALRKVGHAGTLDPLAEGLLIILTGRCTKLMADFLKLDKEYLATIKLGVTSKSFDLETEVVERTSGVNFSEERINEALRKFSGSIEQVPPDYSAAWVNGERAYHLARSGVDFELKPKTVVINEIKIESCLLPFVKLRIVCSSGTYVRSLARDIGEELGCGAILTELVRTRIGSYKVEDAIKLDELKIRCAA
ncbi:MAG: tRNA pseudouridine(55) synthase TruB [Candidatus Kryptoniota bacterium]